MKRADVLDVLGMREHIYGLYCGDGVFAAEDGQVAGLGRGIAADIDDAAGFGVEDDFGDIGMDAGPRRVEDDDVRMSVFGDEITG